MKSIKHTLFITLIILFLNANAKYKLENNFGFLQDITFELYNSTIESSKVPEHTQSIEEILMYDVLHAVWKNNQWVAYTLNEKLLGTYKVGSPSIIENEQSKKMFFIANFPGTKGGTDLYMSEFKDGIWSKPKNMGNKINTIHNESNPGMLDENNLTFSSNGIIKKLNINNYNIEDAPESVTKEKTAIVEKPTPTIQEIKKTTIKPEEAKQVSPIIETKVETTQNINTSNQKFFGKVSTSEMKNKFPNAIQLGAYMNPNWNILNQFSHLGNLITFKNEKDLNTVWLTDFKSNIEMQYILEKIRQTSSFEKAFIVK